MASQGWLFYLEPNISGLAILPGICYLRAGYFTLNLASQVLRSDYSTFNLALQGWLFYLEPGIPWLAAWFHINLKAPFTSYGGGALYPAVKSI
jgi:hypothetical protein